MFPVLPLISLWGALLFGGFAFGRRDDYRRMPLGTRIASSTVLVVLAWWLTVEARSTFSLLIAVGMTLGLVGDLLMAALIPWPQPNVLGGMAAFGLGHIAYIAACLVVGAGLPLGGRLAAWGLWLAAGGVGWHAAVWRRQRIRPFLPSFLAVRFGSRAFFVQRSAHRRRSLQQAPLLPDGRRHLAHLRPGPGPDRPHDKADS